MGKIVQPSLLILGGSGYIGTVLAKFLSQKNYLVDCVDLNWSEGSSVDYGYSSGKKMDYRELRQEDLSGYSAVIQLAGHSNVRASQNDPDGAFENNLVGFYYLIQKIQGQKLIYASSSSIYNGSGDFPAHEEWDQFNPINLYDYTKYSADCLAKLSHLEYYGLRFGTVNGLSPKIREDLMINCMVRTALQNKQVDIYNPYIHRPILGISDLCRAVEAILTKPSQRGFYNLASFNSTVLEIGRYIADFLSVPLYIHEGTPSYDFSISTDKFQQTFLFEFKDQLETIVKSLINHYSKTLCLGQVA